MTTTASSARTCKARKKDGDPCQGRCMPGSDYCLFHDPKRAAQRAEARREGGKARHGRSVTPAGGTDPVKLENARDVLDIVERAINDTLVLENGNQRNRTLGTLAMAALKAFEITELELRVAALEQLIRERTEA